MRPDIYHDTLRSKSVSGYFVAKIYTVNWRIT